MDKIQIQIQLFTEACMEVLDNFDITFKTLEECNTFMQDIDGPEWATGPLQEKIRNVFYNKIEECKEEERLQNVADLFIEHNTDEYCVLFFDKDNLIKKYISPTLNFRINTLTQIGKLPETLQNINQIKEEKVTEKNTSTPSILSIYDLNEKLTIL